MRIEQLAVRSFRNLNQVEADLRARFTVLSGANGAGKTNLLEALYFTSTLRSFRTSNRSSLIRYEAPGCRVELKAFDLEFNTPTRLAVELHRRAKGCKRVATLDGKLVRSAREFYARVPMILFTPEDLGIVRGSPAGRRQFLDRMIFARDRQHIADVQAYEKLLRARNHVLKQAHTQGSRDQLHALLETYEMGLAEQGARIWARRQALIQRIAPVFTEAFADIHDHGHQKRPVSLSYLSRVLVRHPDYRGELSLDSETPQPDELQGLLLRSFRETRARDLQRGNTGRGPHLDDFLLELDQRQAHEHASQGQCRALILALKIAELRLWHQAPPVLLLDDVSSELDPNRNARLFELLADAAGQCLITSTAAEFIRLERDRLDLHIADGALVRDKLPLSDI